MKTIPNIIDVTLRDGGHATNFDWPIKMAQDYYELMCSISQVSFIEVGYWGQTAKSNNRFYNLNMEDVELITKKSGLGNVSVMIDYHYCSLNIDDYPAKDTQKEIGIIRVCARQEDISAALEFSEKLKAHTGLNVSFNIFNVTNYSPEELSCIAQEVSVSNLDFVYFADTHGCLDLDVQGESLFNEPLKILHSNNKKTGLHLHNHSGLAVYNFRQLQKYGFSFSDTSVRGMGKGSGNLALEHIGLNDENLVNLADFIQKNQQLLQMHPTPYELITARCNITDNYAKQGNDMQMPIAKFKKKCEQAIGFGKFVFNPKLLEHE